MAKIADILHHKGNVVHRIEPSATVFDAIRKMADANVGSLLVMEGDQVKGIFTERDYLRRVALEGRTSRETRVDQIMTDKILCVDPDTDLEEVMAGMTEKRIRHLPVIRAGKVVGLVSIGDLVKYVSGERESHIRYLTDYITGKYPA